MATYSTDLTTLTTAESGTWTEFASPYNGGGSPGASGENFIQGTDCYAQNSGKANGLEISIVFDAGSNQTFGTDDVLFAWCFYAIGTNLETYANNGWRFGIGSSTSAWDWFVIGGSDYGRYPYGGWVNVAIDPTATQTGVIGGGNGGNFRYFGNVPYTINEVTKGDPTALDCMRIGRGEISVTGSGGTFAQMASYNDWNSTATPPGTSSTVKDSGYHRLGLFQEQAGTYIWKGLMSMGLSATSVTFTDSNETIIVDDCPHTYADFNKIEINNTSSTVNWTSITFISTGTLAPGNFEVVDATATVNLTTCNFNNLGTFVLGSGTTANSCSWNGCGQITSNGADLTGSSINAYNGTANTSSLVYNTAADPIGELDNMKFTMGTTSTHAIEFGTSSPLSMSLVGITVSGYNTTTNNQNDSTFHIKRTVGTVTISVSGGTAASNLTYRSDGATVVIQESVTFSLTNVVSGTEFHAHAKYVTDTPAGAYNGTGDSVIQVTAAISTSLPTSGNCRLWNGSYYEVYAYTGVSGQQLTGVTPTLSQDFSGVAALIEDFIAPTNITTDPWSTSVAGGINFVALLANASGATKYQPIQFEDNTGSGFARRIEQIED